ncbi:hypothetical protein [Magnetovibrio sp.]|uniref:hypothetical protein n=1 Tax=Magnetovibrio sp. TaxID=2024836 RepID=UPI002F934972
MAMRTERKLMNANANLLGSGVGLATLEAMFSLVNTQSQLAASMVRDHEMSHPIQMQALAGALAQILEASEYARHHAHRNNRNVAIDIPAPAPASQPSPTTGGEGDTEFGAVGGIDALKNLLNKTNTSTNTTSTTTNCPNTDTFEKVLTELMLLLHEMTENSKQTLAVT